MKLLQYGKHNVAFGLTWLRLSEGKVRNEIVAAMEEQHGACGVLRQLSDGYDSRWQLGIADEAEAKGSYSAAAIIANIEKSIIFIDMVGEFVWLCAVSNNEVLPGGDVVGQASTIRERLSELLGEFQDEENTPKVVITESASNALFLVAEDVGDSFEKIVLENENQVFNRKVKLGRVVRLPLSVKVIALLVFAVMGYKFMGITENETVKRISNALPGSTPFQAIERVNLPLGPSEEDILSAALMEEVKWLHDDFVSLAPENVIKDFMTLYKAVPKYKTGWVMKSALYKPTFGQSFLEVSWDRSSLGTADGLLLNLDNIGHLFVSGGDQAVTRHLAKPTGVRAVGRDILSYLNRLTYNAQTLMSDMQSFGKSINWNLQKGKVTSRPKPIEGIKNSSLAVKRQLTQRFESLSISGEGLVSLDALGSYLQKADSIVIRQISINSNMHWTVTGELYEI